MTGQLSLDLKYRILLEGPDLLSFIFGKGRTPTDGAIASTFQKAGRNGRDHTVEW